MDDEVKNLNQNNVSSIENIFNRFGPDVTSWPIKFVNTGDYSFAHVKKMRDVLQKLNVRQPVTFPIRAGLSTSNESQKNLLWLLDQVHKHLRV